MLHSTGCLLYSNFFFDFAIILNFLGIVQNRKSDVSSTMRFSILIHRFSKCSLLCPIYGNRIHVVGTFSYVFLSGDFFVYVFSDDFIIYLGKLFYGMNCSISSIWFSSNTSCRSLEDQEESDFTLAIFTSHSIKLL